MATYLELENLISDPDYHKRLLYGLKQKGFQLILAGEKDKALVASLYSESLKWPIVLFASYCVSHPLMLASGGAITDTNLQTVVNDVYNYLVGL